MGNADNGAARGIDEVYYADTVSYEYFTYCFASPGGSILLVILMSNESNLI